MASAWEQAGELQQVNQRARQLQLGMAVATSLHRHHFERLMGDDALRVMTPALGRVRNLGANAAAGMSMAALVDASTLPLRATGAAMRRIGRTRGPVTRRVVKQGLARQGASSWVTRMNVVIAFQFVRASTDLATVTALRQLVPGLNSPGLDGVTEQTVGNMFGQPGFTVVAEGAPVPVPRLRDFPQSSDSATARDFRNAAREHLARIDPARPTGMSAQRLAKLEQISASVLAELRPQRSYMALAQATIATAAPAVGVAGAPVDDIPTVMAAPSFRQPMYEALRDLAPELLLPGLAEVPADCVLGLATNRRFVEAYLVGLNVEMARELLWRGYPTDQRGTCFAHFWDSRAASEPRPDIAPLHQWNDRALGDAAGAPAREQFVMLMRSALLQRYPNAAVFAVKAVLANGSRRPSREPADEKHPAFSGALPPDVSFFGFDLSTDEATGADGGDGWYLVIQEHPTEPRFGLDVGTVLPGPGSHVSATAAAPSGLPAGKLEWGRNAAHVAGLLRQQPVRVAIHASQLLKRV